MVQQGGDLYTFHLLACSRGDARRVTVEVYILFMCTVDAFMLYMTILSLALLASLVSH